MGNYRKSYISLKVTTDNNPQLATILKCIDEAITGRQFSLKKVIEELNAYKSKKKNKKKSPKLDLEFNEVQNPSIASVVRKYQYDRSFKLETVTLDAYSRKHNLDIDEANIHIGMSADEYARRFNAFALTIGADIYFRNGAYKPETEEGRKLLAHELTHVSQNKDADSYRNASEKELEKEAEQEEAEEVYESDPVIEYKSGRKTYKVRKSLAAQMDNKIQIELEQWVLDQKMGMNEEEYLELLIKYQSYMEERI